jgi:26S proteasome regulatory subunit N8
MPVNHQIVYHLQDALNLLPDLSAEGVKRSFASSTNDQLLVVYLSSLLRAVIALHALVDNKATIGRAELEEGGGGEDKEKDKDKKGKNDEKKDEKDGKKDPSKSDSKGL